MLERRRGLAIALESSLEPVVPFDRSHPDRFHLPVAIDFDQKIGQRPDRLTPDRLRGRAGAFCQYRSGARANVEAVWPRAPGSRASPILSEFIFVLLRHNGELY
jgi:hypothetical protein